MSQAAKQQAAYNTTEPSTFEGGVTAMTITYEYEGALYVNLTNRCHQHLKEA